jgi:ATP-dependent helicase HepA
MKNIPSKEPMQKGQRWVSETEPELGLGVITSLERRQVEVRFPTAGTVRRYARSGSPLRRVSFKPGDSIKDQAGALHHIMAVHAQPESGLLTYVCGGISLSEEQVADTVQILSPLQRLQGGRTGAADAFDTRAFIRRFQADVLHSPARGFSGGRIDLLPHQLYIAQTVSSRRITRALLADETGLGKTIEACLILHRLLVTGRISRALVLVPGHLLLQWFVELHRRFNLTFTLFTREYFAANASETNPFTGAALGIAGLEDLAADPALSAQAVAAGWDLVVVDEAHHLQPESPALALARKFSETAAGLLLLSATPEQYGRRGHYLRLQLLDPYRYGTFEDYEKESGFLRELLARARTGAGPGKMDREQLIDIYGIGRTMFRHTRRTIAGFPRRRVHPAPLDAGPDDPVLAWLVRLVREQPAEKFLVICSTREEAVRIQADILRILKINIALFHEDMTIIQRDRSAAWFSEEEGARLLISSELGSEGRNFQFCQSLVLYDLPLNPELLEQRIGRLDRIGQKGPIHLYIPYIKNTPAEVLCRWYDEGLDAFRQQVPAAGRVFEHLQTELEGLVATPSFIASAGIAEKAHGPGVDAFIHRTAALCRRLSQQVTAPRDRLFEMASVNPDRQQPLIDKILDPVLARKVEIVTGRLLRIYGIAVEHAGGKKHALLTDAVSDLAFPLPARERPVITFDRETALAREDVEFITIDHPMLTGALELFLSSEHGTGAFCAWPDPVASGFLLESIYVLECIAPPPLESYRFLPPALLRIVVDQDGNNVTAGYPADLVRAQCTDVSAEAFRDELAALAPVLRQMVDRSNGFAEAQASSAVAAALASMQAHLGAEISRLQVLEIWKSMITAAERDRCAAERAALETHLQASRIRLDALRLIRRGPLAEDGAKLINRPGRSFLPSEFDD